LRVRRLERRRVLDAAISELVLSPADLDPSTAVHDTNEGTQVNASANATGFGDLFYEWTLRKDGAIVEKSFDPTYSFTPQDNGSFTLTVAVTDSTQSTATETQAILVRNVRPVLIVASDQVVDEGSPLNLSALSASPLGLFIDPGLDDTHTVTVNWGDGSPVETPTMFEAGAAVTLGGSHTYADNGVFEVTVQVTDDDGGMDTKSFFVTVNNFAPTATLENSGPVDEGSSATVSFTNPFDPSGPDTAAGFRYAYDFDNDGVFEVGDGTYAGSVTTDTQMISAALLADGPATRTVRARIIDQDGGFTDYTTDITINNVAPTLNNITVEDNSLEEGDTAVVRMMIDDAGALDVFEVDVDWQDGSAVDTIGGLGLVDATGTVGSTSYEWNAQTRELTLRHEYVDDNPTATPSDTYAVALAVRDDDLGGSGPYMVDITVANVRPVLNVAPDQTVDEGAVLDLSAIGAPPLAVFADEGIADTHTATVDWGDGSDVEMPTLFPVPGAGTLGATHVYQDNGVYMVTVTVTDDDGGIDSLQFQVTVANVAPQLVNVVAADDTIDEGDDATITMNIDDPGPFDTFEVDVDWREGSVDTITGLGASDASGTVGDTEYEWTAATRQLTVTHLYVDDNPTGTASDVYGVLLVVRDNDLGVSDPQQVDVTVRNVRPVLIVAQDQQVDEGTLLELTGFGSPSLAAFIDSGVADTHTAIVNWGDGTGDQATTLTGGGGSFAVGASHTYLDSGSYMVTVSVTDDDGGVDSADFLVTVINVAPTGVLSNSGPVDEGSPATVSFSGQFDPSPTDTAAGFRYAYDFDNDGVFDVGDGTYGGSIASSSELVPPALVADGPATFTVRARIIDKDGGFTDYTTDVTVNNVAPELVNIVVDDATINEGQTATITATIDDPGADTFEVDVDWKDNGPVDTLSLGTSDSSGTVGGTTYDWNAATRQLTVSHLFVDDNPTGTMSDLYTVSLAVRDDDGGASGPYDVGITVSNVRPVLTVAPDQTVDEGSLLDLSGFGAPSLAAFIDVGVADTHTVVVNWGDGTGDEAGALTGGGGSFAVGGTHTYVDDGLYSVTVTVTDDDGGVDMLSFQVTVLNVAPTLVDVAATDATINEGQTAEIVATIVDPGAIDVFSVDVDWHDGDPIDTITGLGLTDESGTVGNTSYTWDADARQLSVRHLFADDNPTATASDPYSVELVVRDDDLAETGPYAVDILVSNLRPVLVVAADQTVNEGSVLDLSASGAPPLALFIDSGKEDTHTVTVNWGDGSGDQGVTLLGASGSFAAGGTHIYADDGDYMVTVTVVDDDGGVDMQSFLVTVENVAPTLTLTEDSFTISESQTVSVPALGSFTDPGFNTETFTFTINWGDDTEDTIVSDVDPATVVNGSEGVLTSGTLGSFTHRYVDNDQDGTYDNKYTVTVTITDDDDGVTVETFEITVLNINPALFPITATDIDANTGTTTLTLSFVDPGMDEFQIMVDWGDKLSEPDLDKRFVEARVYAGPTPNTFVIVHQYLGPPNPLNPTADIDISVKIRDDDFGNPGIQDLGESNVQMVSISNPGIQTNNVAIDTTPDVARLDLTVRPMNDVFVLDTGGIAQRFQPQDARGGGGEVAATTERYLELRIVNPDGSESEEGYRIKDDALLDLRKFFATLPDGRYRIYLVRTENKSPRLVIEVDVRRGRVIDVSDDSEGTRDRPPTSEEEAAQPVPLDENPLLEQVPTDETDAAAYRATGEDSVYVIRPAVESGGNKETGRQRDADVAIGEVDDRFSLSPTLPLSVSLAALAAMQPWSQRVDAALAEADASAWRRLRGAGRLKRAARPPKMPLFSALRAAARLDYNNRN
jgi:PKD repeat protein